MVSGAMCTSFNAVVVVVVSMAQTTCWDCGYEWDYTGSMDNPTCPKCGYSGYRTEVNNDE